MQKILNAWLRRRIAREIVRSLFAKGILTNFMQLEGGVRNERMRQLKGTSAFIDIYGDKREWDGPESLREDQRDEAHTILGALLILTNDEIVQALADLRSDPAFASRDLRGTFGYGWEIIPKVPA